MVKITFMGAGSTVFARNVLGDCMLGEYTSKAEIALYDIDELRLNESFEMLSAINRNINGGASVIKKYCGISNRKEALSGANFIVNAIQVGGYDPCTIADFEIPRKYGLRQTIADTLGIGGIFRALRTIPVMEDFATDIMEVCPNAWFITYVNPMAMLTGYMQRYTGVNTVGLCHSVQVCAKGLVEGVGLEYSDDIHWNIAGINHMAWLLDIKDKDGNDLYPTIKKLSLEKGAPGWDKVRHELMHKFGYYITESSEHNSEYTPYFIKSKYPELIERFNIPLDEYPRRCVAQIEGWKSMKGSLIDNPELSHARTEEYASYIINAIVSGKPYKFGGNVINTGLIDNLPREACVEIPCIADSFGVHPLKVGYLPVQCAALNMTNINVQLMTIEAARTKKKEHIYQAAMLDPHTSSELSIDDIVAMCDDLIEAHNGWLPEYK
jgi:alpha-galactosidase